MNLQNKTICFVVSLKCSYGGNVIPSLLNLADKLTSQFSAKIYWIFPEQDITDWINTIRNKYTIFWLNNGGGGYTQQFYNIFSKEKPDIVHTHYAAYDIYVVKAIHKLKTPTKIVWHIHSHLKLIGTSILRRFRSAIGQFLRFGIYGRHVYLIPVSDEAAAFSAYFRTHFTPFFPKFEIGAKKHYPMSTTIINGIDMSRINFPEKAVAPKIFTFMSFGGIESVKKISFIIQASLLLRNKGISNFHILITNGIGTTDMLTSTLSCTAETIPNWITLVPQSDDISSIFSKASCYISSSIRETMSTAIAEATLFEMPVIQSDIPGTYWNANNPSAILFKNKDINDLAAKMLFVMENYKDLKSKCPITKNNNMKLLSLDHWCDKIIEVYKKL